VAYPANCTAFRINVIDKTSEAMGRLVRKSPSIDRRFFLHFRTFRFRDFEFSVFCKFRIVIVSDSEAGQVM